MELEPQIPRVISQYQSCHFLVCEYRYSEAVLPVCLSFHLGDDILPSVEKIRTTRTVGDDHIGLVWSHRLELLVRIRERIASVRLDVILAESIAAAVPSLRVIYDVASPGFHHSCQHVWIFGSADSF